MVQTEKEIKTEYIIYIQVDFGELKTCFEIDDVLKNQEEVLEVALKKIGESGDIALKDSMSANWLFYEVTEEKTLEDMRIR